MLNRFFRRRRNRRPPDPPVVCPACGGAFPPGSGSIPVPCSGCNEVHWVGALTEVPDGGVTICLRCLRVLVVIRTIGAAGPGAVLAALTPGAHFIWAMHDPVGSDLVHTARHIFRDARFRSAVHAAGLDLAIYQRSPSSSHHAASDC